MLQQIESEWDYKKLLSKFMVFQSYAEARHFSQNTYAKAVVKSLCVNITRFLSHDLVYLK